MPSSLHLPKITYGSPPPTPTPYRTLCHSCTTSISILHLQRLQPRPSPPYASTISHPPHPRPPSSRAHSSLAPTTRTQQLYKSASSSRRPAQSSPRHQEIRPSQSVARSRRRGSPGVVYARGGVVAPANHRGQVCRGRPRWHRPPG